MEHRRLIAAINELDELLKKSPWNYTPEPKSAVESSRTRQEGNDLYVHNKHDEKIHLEILKLYTQSVAFAPMGSEELGLAYGNRSALLAHLKRYLDSIEDLERAMKLATTDIQLIKLMCRKVEYQAELGLEEAEYTCEEAKIILEEIKVTDKVKKKLVVKLVKAIIKLKRGEFKIQEEKPKLDLPNIASSALSITHVPQNYHYGRHLRATRDIVPGEILYVSEPYVSCPIDIYLNCSHCLRFAWSPLPCENCAHAVYCTERCRAVAKQLYHDVECKVMEWIWKSSQRMNAARTMSIRMVIIAVKEAGGLKKLREKFDEVDACMDYRKRGFSGPHFGNNYLSAYSLRTNAKKRSHIEQLAISKDSAVLLHLLAKHTPFFRKYFDSDKRALQSSEDALFVGKLLSHYQHLTLLNAVTVKDLYKVSSTEWNWSPLTEEHSSGLYLTPFLSLLNHSCFPNVKSCEMGDRSTVLYAIKPIAKDEQVFCCYGPMYSEMSRDKRRKLLSERFHFDCDCIACEENWPMFPKLIHNLITFKTLIHAEINATNGAQHKCDEITANLRADNNNFNFNQETIRDFCYAIYLTIKFCKLPNWRIASLTASLVTIFNCIYGHIVGIPEQC
ncbi:SET and MYND domain-containing protein 4-like [Phymastichus coffea]|uniref:SET and MYND domain-containing protein 4-like n=1 Tax=Phymastichus coffea TaxID=108790 RepID=UPI00273B73BC|nr:SET and MYND domain-containing protein 4-like [Phymastichus coffea]